MEPNLDRPYYQDTGRRPYLYYAVMGARAEELQISRSRHHVEEMPQGLALFGLQRPEHSVQMDELLGSTLGKVLSEQAQALYEQARAAQSWLVLQGEVQEDSTLEYLRNAVGIVQAAAETGAAAVLDLQTLTLFSPARWESEVFAPQFRPCGHAVILVSPNPDGTLWFHTRGMRKFGRPDIGLEGVPQGEMDRAAAVINQMIHYGAQGAVFSRPARLHIAAGGICTVYPKLAGDLEDPDFNNEHYQMAWTDCAFEDV